MIESASGAMRRRCDYRIVTTATGVDVFLETVKTGLYPGQFYLVVAQPGWFLFFDGVGTDAGTMSANLRVTRDPAGASIRGLLYRSGTAPASNSSEPGLIASLAISLLLQNAAPPPAPIRTRTRAAELAATRSAPDLSSRSSNRFKVLRIRYACPIAA